MVTNEIDETEIPTCTTLMTLANKNDDVELLKRKLDDANKKLETANAILCKKEKTNKILLQRLRQMRNIKLHAKKKHFEEDWLHKVFAKDQIKYLKANHKGRYVCQWSKETIKKAIRLKYACGDNGYSELLNQHIPLPSARTLRRRLENITFKEGICDEIFNLLKEKVACFLDEREKDCMICVDEMSLTPGEQIDPSTNSIIGYATIPDTSGKSLYTRFSKARSTIENKT